MRFYDSDELADARAEAQDEGHAPDTTCSECGAEWWGNWTRGRWDPPEPRNPDCPVCEA